MSHSTRVLTAVCPAAIASRLHLRAGRAALVQRLDSIAGAAAAFRGKDKLLLEAYSKADVESNTPMTAGTRHRRVRTGGAKRMNVGLVCGRQAQGCLPGEAG
jgi:hypothetical protein